MFLRMNIFACSLLKIWKCHNTLKRFNDESEYCFHSVSGGQCEFDVVLAPTVGSHALTDRSLLYDLWAGDRNRSVSLHHHPSVHSRRAGPCDDKRRALGG